MSEIRTCSDFERLLYILNCFHLTVVNPKVLVGKVAPREASFLKKIKSTADPTPSYNFLQREKSSDVTDPFFSQ